MTALALVLAIAAQQPAAPAAPKPDPTTQAGSAQSIYGQIKQYILQSAEKMPAEHFAFQPTPEVRSFGQVLAHIVDANYLLCAPALGVPSPNGDAIQKTEQEKLGREAMMQRLKESVTFCDKAYDQLTETSADEAVNMMGRQRPRLAVLWFHISHAFEHYGNLVTYMRLKGIVPPSSEGR